MCFCMFEVSDGLGIDIIRCILNKCKITHCTRLVIKLTIFVTKDVYAMLASIGFCYTNKKKGLKVHIYMYIEQTIIIDPMDNIFSVRLKPDDPNSTQHTFTHAHIYISYRYSILEMYEQWMDPLKNI